jgi:hypothetical protein
MEIQKLLNKEIGRRETILHRRMTLKADSLFEGNQSNEENKEYDRKPFVTLVERDSESSEQSSFSSQRSSFKAETTQEIESINDSEPDISHTPD